MYRKQSSSKPQALATTAPAPITDCSAVTSQMPETIPPRLTAADPDCLLAGWIDPKLRPWVVHPLRSVIVAAKSGCQARGA
jgi:hypothetical protein